MTVIVSSHILDELAKVADAFGIINDGKLIDEFTSEELDTRCGTYLVLKTGDIEKTQAVLKDMGISSCELLENGKIKIMQAVDDTSKLVVALVEAGVPVYELALVQTTLEQYYLTRTGGEV